MPLPMFRSLSHAPPYFKLVLLTSRAIWTIARSVNRRASIDSRSAGSWPARTFSMDFTLALSFGAIPHLCGTVPVGAVPDLTQAAGNSAPDSSAASTATGAGDSVPCRLHCPASPEDAPAGASPPRSLMSQAFCHLDKPDAEIYLRPCT